MSLNDEVAGVKDDLVNVYSTISDVNSTVEDNSALITGLTDDVEFLTSSVQQQETINEDIIKRLDTISTKGRWCGYQGNWKTHETVIKYDKTLFSNTNKAITETPLNINTGR